jgi:hypothetical protein
MCLMYFDAADISRVYIALSVNGIVLVTLSHGIGCGSTARLHPQREGKGCERAWPVTGDLQRE